MSKVLARAALAAAAFLLACTCGSAQMACIGQYGTTCNSLVQGHSAGNFDCGFAQQHSSNPDQAAAQQVCSGHGGLLKYNRTQSVGGNQCGYTVVHVGCMNAVLCTGQSAAGCNNVPNYVPTDFHDCSYAAAHSTSLDLDAATEYCASGNMGLVSVERLGSYGGGQCGYTYDAVHCAPYQNGSLFPKYYILTLIYAPPGCGDPSHSCSADNSVTYSHDSSTGTATELEQTSGNSVSVDLKVGTDAASVGGSFEASKTNTNSTTETITRSGSGQLTVNGQQDGVNHDLDQFTILLNPAIFTVSVGNHITWNMGWRPMQGFSPPLNNPYTDVVYVYELKHPLMMRAGIKADFQKFGITTADYATILAQDPYAFANPSTPPSPRFAQTTLNFNYEPPLPTDPFICANGVCSCNSLTGDIKNEFETENVSSSEQSYKVGVTVNGSVPDVIDLTMGGEMTWGNTSTTTHTTSNSETASASISCPSSGYTGQTHMAVFWDTIYGSFLFVPQGPITDVGSVVGGPIIYQGLVVAKGNPVARQVVELKVGKVTYRTTTNNKGEYAFRSSALKPGRGQPLMAELAVGGVKRSVALGETARTQVEISKPLSPGRVTPNPRPSVFVEKPGSPARPAPYTKGADYVDNPPPPSRPLPNAKGDAAVGYGSTPKRGCSPPLVAGPDNSCNCPQGTQMQGGACVKQTSNPYPHADAQPAQQNSCPQGTVQKGGQCVRSTISCRAPQVPNPAGTGCGCPAGTVSRGQECIAEKQTPQK